ncbi:metal-dependent transcriptional regulator [bacterium]|nr:metal-dependent transcriptional regulator [bacterium]
MVRQSIEDYLKTIFELQAEGEENLAVTNSRVAERMGVSAASATNMIKKLAEDKMVAHTPYKGVRLTESGESMALGVLRRHRLLELYLFSELHFSWDQVHEEAERLEHAVSDAFIEKIDKKMGHPTLDPHGAPIPDGNGKYEKWNYIQIAAMEPGQAGTVRSVTDKDPSMLRFLEEIGLQLDAYVELVKKEPFGGSLIVRVNHDQEEPLGMRLANEVFVEVERQNEET